MRRFPSSVPGCRAEIIAMLWSRVPGLETALPLAEAAKPLLGDADLQLLASQVPGCESLWKPPASVGGDEDDGASADVEGLQI